MHASASGHRLRRLVILSRACASNSRPISLVRRRGRRHRLGRAGSRLVGDSRSQAAALSGRPALPLRFRRPRRSATMAAPPCESAGLYPRRPPSSTRTASSAAATKYCTIVARWPLASRLRRRTRSAGRRRGSSRLKEGGGIRFPQSASEQCAARRRDRLRHHRPCGRPRSMAPSASCQQPRRLQAGGRRDRIGEYDDRRFKPLGAMPSLRAPRRGRSPCRGSPRRGPRAARQRNLATTGVARRS